ncbi:MAG TPA: phage tail tube protein [Solirubrobacterales bacterium]|nr:phage tail tube protein [Solirubrobacterales bacterium]
MPHGSGLDAQLGVALEATYGTRVAPVTFLPFESESLTLNKTYIETQPLMAGVMVQPEGYHVSSTRSVEGSIELQYFDRGMGKFLTMLTGGVIPIVTPGGAVAARTQTFPIGLTSPVGKSLSLQVGRPDTDGVVRPFDYLGCKVTEAVISIESGEAATLSLNIDGRDEKTDQTLGTATYSAAARPFGFRRWEISIAGAPHMKCKTLTITVPVNMATDRHNLGNSGVKDEPLVNAQSDITMAATFEFASLADHQRYLNETIVSLVAKATNDLIEGAFSYGSEITIPSAKQISSGPVVGGADLLTVDAEFKALYNGTNAPMTIVNTNTDTAL